MDEKVSLILNFFSSSEDRSKYKDVNHVKEVVESLNKIRAIDDYNKVLVNALSKCIDNSKWKVAYQVSTELKNSKVYVPLNMLNKLIVIISSHKKDKEEKNNGSVSSLHISNCMKQLIVILLRGIKSSPPETQISFLNEIDWIGSSEKTFLIITEFMEGNYIFHPKYLEYNAIQILKNPKSLENKTIFKFLSKCMTENNSEFIFCNVVESKLANTPEAWLIYLKVLKTLDIKNGSKIDETIRKLLGFIFDLSVPRSDYKTLLLFLYYALSKNKLLIKGNIEKILNFMKSIIKRMKSECNEDEAPEECYRIFYEIDDRYDDDDSNEISVIKKIWVGILNTKFYKEAINLIHGYSNSIRKYVMRSKLRGNITKLINMSNELDNIVNNKLKTLDKIKSAGKELLARPNSCDLEKKLNVEKAAALRTEYIRLDDEISNDVGKYTMYLMEILNIKDKSNKWLYGNRRGLSRFNVIELLKQRCIDEVKKASANQEVNLNGILSRSNIVTNMRFISWAIGVYHKTTAISGDGFGGSYTTNVYVDVIKEDILPDIIRFTLDYIRYDDNCFEVADCIEMIKQFLTFFDNMKECERKQNLSKYITRMVEKLVEVMVKGQFNTCRMYAIDVLSYFLVSIIGDKIKYEPILDDMLPRYFAVELLKVIQGMCKSLYKPNISNVMAGNVCHIIIRCSNLFYLLVKTYKRLIKYYDIKYNILEFIRTVPFNRNHTRYHKVPKKYDDGSLMYVKRLSDGRLIYGKELKNGNNGMVIYKDNKENVAFNEYLEKLGPCERCSNCRSKQTCNTRIAISFARRHSTRNVVEVGEMKNDNIIYYQTKWQDDGTLKFMKELPNGQGIIFGKMHPKTGKVSYRLSGRNGSSVQYKVFENELNPRIFIERGSTGGRLMYDLAVQRVDKILMRQLLIQDVYEGIAYLMKLYLKPNTGKTNQLLIKKDALETGNGLKEKPIIYRTNQLLLKIDALETGTGLIKVYNVLLNETDPGAISKKGFILSLIFQLSKISTFEFQIVTKKIPSSTYKRLVSNPSSSSSYTEDKSEDKDEDLMKDEEEEEEEEGDDEGMKDEKIEGMKDGYDVEDDEEIEKRERMEDGYDIEDDEFPITIHIIDKQMVPIATMISNLPMWFLLQYKQENILETVVKLDVKSRSYKDVIKTNEINRDTLRREKIHMFQQAVMLYMREAINNIEEAKFALTLNEGQLNEFNYVKSSSPEIRSRSKVYEKFQLILKSIGCYSNDRSVIEKLFVERAEVGKEFVMLLNLKDRNSDKLKNSIIWNNFLEYARRKGMDFTLDKTMAMEMPSSNFKVYKSILARARGMLNNKDKLPQIVDNISKTILGILYQNDDDHHMIALTLMIMFYQLDFNESIHARLKKLFELKVNDEKSLIITNPLIKKIIIYLLLHKIKLEMRNKGNTAIGIFERRYGDFKMFSNVVREMKWYNETYANIASIALGEKITVQFRRLGEFRRECIGDDLNWLNEINVITNMFELNDKEDSYDSNWLTPTGNF